MEAKSAGNPTRLNPPPRARAICGATTVDGCVTVAVTNHRTGHHLAPSLLQSLIFYENIPASGWVWTRTKGIAVTVKPSRAFILQPEARNTVRVYSDDS